MKTSKKEILKEDKKQTFLDSPEWAAIVDNIRSVMTSDGTMATLLDFERVLDEADVYAYKNWILGELVDGPIINRYDVVCTFMWPHKLMPDPRGGKRLLALGCGVKFKEVTIKVPIEIKSPSDYKPGTHYPKLIDRKAWLINIVVPKKIMNDIREGSIEIADQSVQLEDLDDAYAQDYDQAEVKDQGADMGGGMGPGPGLGGMPPPPPPAPGGAPAGGMPL